jgi:hypothetical protein
LVVFSSGGAVILAIVAVIRNLARTQRSRGRRGAVARDGTLRRYRNLIYETAKMPLLHGRGAVISRSTG